MLEETSLHVKKMLEEFQGSWEDALHEVMLSPRGNPLTIPDTGIFISTKQSENYYSDIFQFWVRAFFCFGENTGLWDVYEGANSNINCIDISADRFEKEYKDLLTRYVPPTFWPSIVELENRTFNKAYLVLDTAVIKSAVAESDGEYLAYFETRN